MHKKNVIVAALLSTLIFVSSILLAACKDRTHPDDPTQPAQDRYIVTFDSMGGTSVQSQTVKSGEKAIRPEDPQKAGADFIDWFSNEKLIGDPFDFDTAITRNITLYASWSDVSFSVQFDVNGGYPIVAYQTVNYGKTVDEPMQPSRVGYEFGGWYTDVAFTEDAVFPYKIEKNTNFYAKWTSDRDVTVNFRIAKNVAFSSLPGYDGENIDYEQAIAEPITISAGQKLEQPENPKDISYTDDGGKVHTYKFSYWSTSPIYNSVSQTYAVLFPIRETYTEEITLYAVYNEFYSNSVHARLTVHPENGEKETVMYGSKGSYINVAPLDAINEAPFYSDLKEPYYEGHKVTGYYKSPDLNVKDIYQIPFVLENDANDVYLRWEKAPERNASLYADGKDICVSYDYGGRLARPENPIKAGYTFDGWYKNGDMAIEENRWDFERDRAFDSVINLHAKFVKTATVVNFDTRGGYDRNHIAVSSGYEIKKLPVPARKNGSAVYDFLGWYKNSACTDPIVLPYRVDEDITLYAKWGNPIDISALNFNYRGNGVYTVSAKATLKNAIKGKLTLPQSYGGYRVLAVETEGFKDCKSLTEVIIPEGYIYVYSYAFSGCTALEKVVLSDTVKQLALYCFKGCTNLSDVNIPKNLASIASSCFADSPNMRQKFTAYNGMYYWDTVFMGDANGIKGLTTIDKTTVSLTLRDGTTVVAMTSLYYMRALKTLTLADSVKYITGDAFPREGYSALTTLNLSKSYTPTTFTPNYPSSLVTINVPTENPYYKMIDGCLMIESEKRLEASVKSAVKIPDETVVIGKRSFTYKNLATVEIPDTVTAIHAEAFYGCKFTDIDIPDNVGVLDKSAFAKCTEMKNLTFGAKTERQTKDLFKDMNKLETLEVSSRNVSMRSKDSVLYDKNSYDIIYAAAGYSGDVEILEGTKNIPADVDFKGSYGNFIIADSVETIGNSVFFWTQNIDKLSFGKNSPKVSCDSVFGGSMYSEHCINEFYLPTDNPNMSYKDGVLYSKDMTEMLFVPYKTDTLDIPDSVTVLSIGNAAMYLKALRVGAGISKDEFMRLIYDTESLNYGQFLGAESVAISPNNGELTEFGGVIYTKDLQHIVYIPIGFDGDLVLPKEMTSLDEFLPAMTSLYRLPTADEDADWRYPNSITIRNLFVEDGSKLRSIGEYAISAHYLSSSKIPEWVDFQEYERREVGFSIAAIDFTNATELDEIGIAAVEGSDVRSIKLPPSVRTIGFAAFAMCSELMHFEASLLDVTTIGSMAFYYADGLYNDDGLMIISGVLTGLSDRKDWRDVELVIPKYVVGIITSGVFAHDLRSVVIPSSVVTAQAGAIQPRDVPDFTIYLEADAVPEGFQDGWYDADSGATVTVVTGYVGNS